MNIRTRLNRIVSDPDFQELHRIYTAESFFGILNVKERELVHTSLLGWFLNPRANHGMGSWPLRQFLFLCSRHLENAKQHFTIFRNREFIDPASINAVDLDRLTVAAEYDHDNGRCDIFAYSKQFSPDDLEESERKTPYLLVEYKINAAEGNKQTARYVDFVSKLMEYGEGDRYPLLVYVSPSLDGHVPCEPFVGVNFKELLGWVEMLSRNPTKTPLAGQLLAEYAAVLDSITDGVNNSEVVKLKRQLTSNYGSYSAEIANGLAELVTTDLEASDVITEYGRTMNQIGINTRISAPPSEIVNKQKSMFSSVLNKEKWEMSGANCLMIKNLGFRSLISGVFGREVSNPRLQIYVESTGSAALKIFWNQSAATSENCVIRLCSSLRERLGNLSVANWRTNLLADSKTLGSIGGKNTTLNGDNLQAIIQKLDAVIDSWLTSDAREILQAERNGVGQV